MTEEKRGKIAIHIIEYYIMTYGIPFNHYLYQEIESLSRGSEFSKKEIMDFLNPIVRENIDRMFPPLDKPQSK